MSILIDHKKHFKTRLLPIVMALILFAQCPVIIEIVGRNLHEWKKGTPCTQQNCSTWGMTWLIMISYPLAFLGFCTLGFIVFIDLFLKKKNKNSNEN